jgi:hypothetical protein
MTISVASPITGATATGYLTSPTFTIVSDQTDFNGKGYIVTALGGTQTNVVVNSPSSPFSLQIYKPKVWKTLPPLQLNGQLGSVGTNTITVVAKKGVTVLAGQPKRVATAKLEFVIPAGADIADPNNAAALISMLIGALAEQSNELMDLAVTGAL